MEFAEDVASSITGSEKKFEMRLRMGPRARPSRDSSIREVQVAITVPASTRAREDESSEKSRARSQHIRQRQQLCSSDMRRW